MLRETKYKNDKNDNSINPKLIITYIARNISLNESVIFDSIYKNKNSIFEMTFNQYLNLTHLIPLLEKRDEIGIIDFLINVMAQKFLNESFFYLPLICVMAIYKVNSHSIEYFILDRCLNHLKFSLYTTLLLCSFPPSQKIQTMTFHIEELMLCGIDKRNLSKNLKNDFAISNHPAEKDPKVNYYYKCLEFYENLKGLSLLLFQYPQHQEGNKLGRKQVLKEFILLINNEINSMRKENYKRKLNDKDHENKKYNKGYLLPFNNPLSNFDDQSYIIVSILSDYSSCFNTKLRVPIKLCCECIEMEECGSFYSLYEDETFFENSIDLSEENNVFDSVSIHLSKQLSTFNSKKVKLFDKWANLERLMQHVGKPLIEQENKKVESKALNSHFFIAEMNEEGFVEINYNTDVISPFGEPVERLFDKLKSKSPFKNFRTYQIKTFISKANDNLMQEMFVMQTIKIFKSIFEKIDIYVATYEILITSDNSGLVEYISNTCSIDEILKSTPGNWSLNKFFRNFFYKEFKTAQMEFARSLAGFCLLSYYLQIKDRHNGNILLDNKGHIMHIDFGFVLGASPKNLNFEKANFKLTQDYIDILDGFKGEAFNFFKGKLVEGIIECKKYYEILSTIIVIMSKSNLKFMQLQNINEIMKSFQSRFLFQLKRKEIEDYVDKMILESYENFWTKKYDYFQYFTNKISY